MLCNCKTKEATNPALAGNRQLTQQEQKCLPYERNKRYVSLQHLLSHPWVSLVIQIPSRTVPLRLIYRCGSPEGLSLRDTGMLRPNASSWMSKTYQEVGMLSFRLNRSLLLSCICTADIHFRLWLMSQEFWIWKPCCTRGSTNRKHRPVSSFIPGTRPKKELSWQYMREVMDIEGPTVQRIIWQDIHAHRLGTQLAQSRPVSLISTSYLCEDVIPSIRMNRYLYNS